MKNNDNPVLSVRISPELKDKYIKKASDLEITISEAAHPVLRLFDMYYNPKVDINNLIEDNQLNIKKIDSLENRVLILRKMVNKYKSNKKCN